MHVVFRNNLVDTNANLWFVQATRFKRSGFLTYGAQRLGCRMLKGWIRLHLYLITIAFFMRYCPTFSNTTTVDNKRLCKNGLFLGRHLFGSQWGQTLNSFALFAWVQDLSNLIEAQVLGIILKEVLNNIWSTFARETCSWLDLKLWLPPLTKARF